MFWYDKMFYTVPSKVHVKTGGNKNEKKNWFGSDINTHLRFCFCRLCRNDTDVAKTSQTENTQTAYQWDTTLKGSLFISDNQFGYKGYSKNVKYSEIFTEADDVKKNTTGANKYSATVREAQKFSDFSTGNVAEKYIFSTEDDLLNAVVVILTPDGGEAWSNFNERAAEAFQTVFAGKTIQKQESTAKEDGIAIMGNWQVKDDSGNSITIEFGSEIDITVKFN